MKKIILFVVATIALVGYTISKEDIAKEQAEHRTDIKCRNTSTGFSPLEFREELRNFGEEVE